MRSVLVLFAADNSEPDALTDVLTVLPNASMVNCIDRARKFNRLRENGVINEETFFGLVAAYCLMQIGNIER